MWSRRKSDIHNTERIRPHPSIFRLQNLVKAIVPFSFVPFSFVTAYDGNDIFFAEIQPAHTCQSQQTKTCLCEAFT